MADPFFAAPVPAQAPPSNPGLLRPGAFIMHRTRRRLFTITSGRGQMPGPRAHPCLIHDDFQDIFGNPCVWVVSMTKGSYYGRPDETGQRRLYRKQELRANWWQPVHWHPASYPTHSHCEIPPDMCTFLGRVIPRSPIDLYYFPIPGLAYDQYNAQYTHEGVCIPYAKPSYMWVGDVGEAITHEETQRYHVMNPHYSIYPLSLHQIHQEMAYWRRLDAPKFDADDTQPPQEAYWRYGEPMDRRNVDEETFAYELQTIGITFSQANQCDILKSRWPPSLTVKLEGPHSPQHARTGSAKDSPIALTGARVRIRNILYVRGLRRGTPDCSTTGARELHSDRNSSRPDHVQPGYTEIAMELEERRQHSLNVKHLWEFIESRVYNLALLDGPSVEDVSTRLSQCCSRPAKDLRGLTCVVRLTQDQLVHVLRGQQRLHGLCSSLQHETLKVCGLVARKWYLPSRIHLFERAFLDDERISAFKDLLDQSPHLGHYIRKITLSTESADHLSCIPSIIKYVDNAEELHLTCITKPFPRAAAFAKIGPVKYLHIYHGRLIEGDTEDLLAIAEYLETFPCITKLSLHTRMADALSGLNITSLRVDSYTPPILVHHFRDHPPVNIERVDIQDHGGGDFNHNLQLIKIVGGRIKVLQIILWQVACVEYIYPVSPAMDQAFGSLTQLKLLKMIASRAYVDYAAELLSRLVAPALETLYMELEYNDSSNYAARFLNACISISDKLSNIDTFPRLCGIMIYVSGSTENEEEWEMMETVVSQLLSRVSARGILKLEFQYVVWNSDAAFRSTGP
ncbi:hypothetical protein CERSUDRAFT_75267 [Gelatoporia subvermispora B]|uniref:Uncharacterized protein n=1 Tax=Ceriporiopsis subvermispora (strain B) TaxID=914234 RepID=M2R8D2_CERS8|nr:hypothetical protein CERSUDRAFT_75267 [Gelatoporia subvermispora B]